MYEVLEMNEKLIRIVNELRTDNANSKFLNCTDNFHTLDKEEQKSIELQAEMAADKLVDCFWEDINASLRIGDMMDSLNFVVARSSTFSSDEISGILAINQDIPQRKIPSKLILVNDNDNIGHQRFTIAHELAHYIFDVMTDTPYYEAYYRIDEEKNKEIKEYRANKFAANLLMPKSIFIPRYEYLTNKLSNKSTVNKFLSRDFSVSLTAIEKRVQELKLG